MRFRWRRLCTLQILVIVVVIFLVSTNRLWKAPESTFSGKGVQIPTNLISDDGNDAMSLQVLPNPVPPSRNHSLIYVHVGKTGGISLDSVLQSNCMWYYGKSARDKCLRYFEQQESSSSSKLSDLTRATLHFGPRRDYNDWIHNATLFLLTLRNPIARTVSAFNFDHPSNHDPSRYGDQGLPDDTRRFFVDCFPTIHDLASSLRGGWKYSFTRTGKRCRSIAIQALAGNGTKTAVPHLHMNYNYYHKLSTALYPDRPVLALRTEFLWHDLRRLDRMLGGDGDYQADGITYTHGSQAFHVNQGLTGPEKKVLCCHLEPELQLYQDLIERSVNLLVSEKSEVLDLLYQDCGRGMDTLILSWQDWATTACSI